MSSSLGYVTLADLEALGFASNPGAMDAIDEAYRICMRELFSLVDEATRDEIVRIAIETLRDNMR